MVVCLCARPSVCLSACLCMSTITKNNGPINLKEIVVPVYQIVVYEKSSTLGIVWPRFKSWSDFFSITTLQIIIPLYSNKINCAILLVKSKKNGYDRLHYLAFLLTVQVLLCYPPTFTMLPTITFWSKILQELIKSPA